MSTLLSVDGQLFFILPLGMKLTGGLLPHPLFQKI